ncbi:MAG: Ig domain-containing protein, partial [Candidatus Sulfotelmatobacter sp.]
MFLHIGLARTSGLQNRSSKPSTGAKFGSLFVLLSATFLIVSCSSVSVQNPNSTAPTVANENISVHIVPAIAEVQSGARLQLMATVTGTGSTGVAWSSTEGNVSDDGVFQAPSVTTATVATVTAVSAGRPTKSGLARVTILPASSTPGLAITSASMPSGRLGVNYSATVNATGGNEPYTWKAISGTLPTGLALDPADGIISGKPTQAGTYTFQIQVTDAFFNTAKASSNVVVSADQTSQTSGNFDGPAELPRTYLQTAMLNTPAPGSTIEVNSGGNLQSALNSASCGDTIQLQAGAIYSGFFVIPAKACDDDHWIIVRTSAPDSTLPAEGSRITPCYAGVASLPGRPAFSCSAPQNVLAKILYTRLAGSGPIQFANGANHYRFVGLEIARPA